MVIYYEFIIIKQLLLLLVSLYFFLIFAYEIIIWSVIKRVKLHIVLVPRSAIKFGIKSQRNISVNCKFSIRLIAAVLNERLYYASPVKPVL